MIGFTLVADSPNIWASMVTEQVVLGAKLTSRVQTPDSIGQSIQVAPSTPFQTNSWSPIMTRVSIS